MTSLKQTPLFDMHRSLGAKMVDFAGYAMPVQFEGILAEHRHCRASAGLFDVSHMGQVLLRGRSGQDPAPALERLVSGRIAALAPGRARYTLLLNADGGIVDDLIVTRRDPATLYLVINAARKEVDLAALRAGLGDEVAIDLMHDQALLALQGPNAESVLQAVVPGVADLGFMAAAEGLRFGNEDLAVSRSGYTGEDGFEISVPAAAADRLARRLLEDDRVKPIGLGARDSLRLEAGLCLYGQDLDETTSPVEADLLFALPKARRQAGDFPGAARIVSELAEGPARKRVGIRPEGRAIARPGVAIQDTDGTAVGVITSGGFGPTVEGPIAMGYVPPALAEPGTALTLSIRGKPHPAVVAPTPFVEQRYKRKP
ncbi:MAG: glycine cleavage system aminomethyltransferase GcvT [Rhodothalassiaceae bacterium]